MYTTIQAEISLIHVHLEYVPEKEQVCFALSIEITHLQQEWIRSDLEARKVSQFDFSDLPH